MRSQIVKRERTQKQKKKNDIDPNIWGFLFANALERDKQAARQIGISTTIRLVRMIYGLWMS